MAAGGGTRGGVCRRGHRNQSDGGGCRVLCLWPGLGGGAGGGVWGWHCWWWGGRGWVLLWPGLWASRRVLRVSGVRAVRSLQSLAGCGAEVRVGGGRTGVRAGLWSVGNGWLPVDGARWYGVLVEGLLVVGEKTERKPKSHQGWAHKPSPQVSLSNRGPFR